jgi:uncharacterized membrane protein YjjB (DUF3815 family)
LAALGGLLACGVYLLVKWWLGGEFIPNMLGALAGALFSEVCARRTAVPVSVYLTPCIVPLVPGGMLYQTMSCLVRGDLSGAGSYGLTTLTMAMGISGGIVMASVLAMLILPRGGRHAGRPIVRPVPRRGGEPRSDGNTNMQKK